MLITCHGIKITHIPILSFCLLSCTCSQRSDSYKLHLLKFINHNLKNDSELENLIALKSEITIFAKS